MGRREWLALLAVSLAVAAYVGVGGGGGWIDLRVYRLGGETVFLGGLYDVRLHPEGLAFTYPPIAAMLFAPVAALPVSVAAALWSFGTVVALGYAVGLVVRVLSPAAPWWTSPALTAGSLALEPVWSHLSFGQINTLLMALVVHDLLRADRRWSGALVGLAAGLKLTPLVFVVFLLLVGRIRAAALAAGSFVATVVVGFLVTPRDAWAYWTALAGDADRVGGVAYAGNQSALSVLWRLLGHEPSTLVWLVVAGALGVGTLLLGVVAWRRGDAVGSVLGTCLAAAAMLLASPISWNHHWVWAVPLVLVLWHLGAVPARAVALAWVLVTAAAVVRWPPRSGDREVLWTPLEQVAGNAYFLAAIGSVAVSAWWLRAHTTSAGRPDTAVLPAGR